MKSKIRLFEFDISSLSLKQTVGWIGENVGTVYCCNLNDMKSGKENLEVRSAMQKADLITADGMPLVWLMRSRGVKSDRVYGPDLMEEAIKKYKNKKHFFLGSTWQNLELIKDRMIKEEGYNPRQIELWSPPVKSDFDREEIKEMAKKITNFKADIVWVGMGSEKQIILADQLKKELPKVVFITVGAAFDFYARTKRQAPRWIQQIGGEWLFRWITEPKRLGNRYMGIILFLFETLARRQPQAWAKVKATRN